MEYKETGKKVPYYVKPSKDMHVDCRLFMPTYLSFLTERVIMLDWTVLKKIDSQI
jgi:hypothetical protein